MRQLLDTHVFIWYMRGDPSLSQGARDLIEAPEAENLVSVASLWEIAIKTSLGKIEIGKPFAQIQEDLDNNGFLTLGLQFEHLNQVSNLPFIHRDPFDRLLIAQAMIEKIPLITADEIIPQYPLQTHW